MIVIVPLAAGRTATAAVAACPGAMTAWRRPLNLIDDRVISRTAGCSL